MATMVRIYSRSGAYLTDLRCEVAWSQELNAIGRAEITIGKTDPAFTEVNTRIGNRVLIEHDNGLKWGGVLDVPQNWGDDPVTLIAYTAERKLQGRNATEASYTGTAGAIFTSLIADANYEEHIGVTVQDAYSSGSSWTEPAQDGNLYQILQRIQKRSGQDWSIDPRVTASGQLVFDARWHQQSGRVWNYTIEENKHIKRGKFPLMSVQGKVVNRWRIKTYDGNQYTTIVVEDEDSINTYGLWEDTEVVTLPSGISASDYGAVRLAQTKAPRTTYRPVAVNENSAFSYLGIGDTVALKLLHYGFTGSGLGREVQVRVIARQFNEVSGELALTVDEVI